MINKNTILSAFDDKGTLLKWLKKVENALKESVLSNVEVIKITDTRAVIKFIFADNTSITTPEFTLPKGPKGDGIELLGSLYSNTPSFITSNPAGNFIISTTVDFYLNNGETITVPATFTSTLRGSESVIVDISEDNRHIEIHLDADIVSKISRALSIPLTSREKTQIVCITPQNSQIQLNIGEGFVIEDNELSISTEGLKSLSINSMGLQIGITLFECVYNGRYYKQLSLNQVFTGEEDIKAMFFYFYYIPSLDTYVKYVNIPILNFNNDTELRTNTQILNHISKCFLLADNTVMTIDAANE